MNTRKYLLRAEDIENLAGKKITHFQNPNGIRLNKSLGDEVGMSEMGVHMIYVEPGHDSTEFHKHLYEEECIFVISGTGKLTLENDEYDIGVGDFVGLPANEVAHQLSNNGSETLTCLVMGQRLKHDIADYPKKQKRIYRHDGNAEVVNHENIDYPTIHTGRNKKSLSMSNQEESSSSYQPIQCQLYDYIEIACMRRYNLDLELTTNEIITGKALTTRIKDKQEFMVIETTDGKQEIRLDTVKSITALDENAEFGKVEIN